jgi:hypothetical protein
MRVWLKDLFRSHGLEEGGLQRGIVYLATT